MPSTGIKKLDEVLMDGIPDGSSVIVMGTPSSGMELFAKQFASADKNENAVYFTTSETESEVKSMLKSYKWREDISIVSISTQYYEKILAKELEASRLKKEGLSVSDIAKLGTFEGREEINFLETLTYEISKLKKNYRVVVDSLDFFLERYLPEDVLSAVRTIESHVHYTKGLALFTMVKDIYDKRIENSIAAVADCVIELEVVKIGTGFENRLVVQKVKNMPQKIDTLIYSITDKGKTPETKSKKW